MARGYCKLTGEYGKFVASHLIPKALTRPAKAGLPFVEAGLGKRPTRRWNSWYDGRLVIRAGEDVLSALDDWAIRELRKHRLVWSGWEPSQSLLDHTQMPGTPWGIREVEGIDPRKLRLFFLSLLWRAAATERPEFSDVTLPSADLEKLRLMLLESRPEPLSFYPVRLIQLSTVGVVHNHTPITDVKHIPAIDGQPERQIPIFRFYFDGLIAHVQRQAHDDGETEALGPLVVGNQTKLVVSTVTYEGSLQHMHLRSVMEEALEGWPEVMTRL